MGSAKGNQCQLLFPAPFVITAERKHIQAYQNRLREDVLFHPEIDCVRQHSEIIL